MRRYTQTKLLGELGKLLRRIRAFRLTDAKRKQSQEGNESFRHLARRLTASLSIREIARIVSEESRLLFHHDAFTLSYYDRENGHSISAYSEDTPQGHSAPMESPSDDFSSEFLLRDPAYAGRSTLINRGVNDDSRVIDSFGEKDRRAQSLMFAPILWSGDPIGMVSVRSYTPGCYSERDLRLLETLSSHCGEALWRVSTGQNAEILSHSLESISEMVTITDLEDRFIYVNSAFCKRFGYARDEVLGAHVNLLWSPSNPPGTLERILKETREGGCVIELMNRTQAGDEFPIELRTSPLRNNEGKVLGLIGISIDITERKRAENRLSVYAELGRQLSQVSNAYEAAKIIVESADEILGWDSCLLVRYSERENRVTPILAMDLIDDHRVECQDSLNQGPPGFFIQKVIQEGGQLVLRTKESLNSEVRPFGDRGRRSASLLFSPVRREGKIVAVLSIQSYRPNAYIPRDLQTLQSFADYCGGALERIEAEDRLRESEIRRAAFAALAHRLNSVRTPKEAGYIIAETADQLLGFDACFIDLYSAETQMTYHVLNIDTVDNKKVEFPQGNLGRLTTMKKRVLSEGAFLILREPAQMQGEPATRETLGFGMKNRPSASLIHVPVRRGDKVVGFISIQSYTPNAYSEGDLELMQDLADHCGGAFERIRIEQQIIEEQRRIERFAELGRVLSAAETPKEAGRIILGLARELIGWDACFLMLYSRERDHFSPIYSMDLIDGQSVELEPDCYVTHPENTGYIRQVLEQGKLMVLRTREEMTTSSPNTFGDTARLSASLLFVPVVSGNRTIGVLSIQSYSPQAYCQDDLDLLESLAQHCSGCLERIRAEGERRNLETQVQQAQKLESLGVLAGGIAHDFNNLLTSILGNSDLALQDLPPSSPVRASIAEIERASRKAADLCRQMLAYSGKGRFLVQAVDVNKVVEELGSLLDRSVSERVVFEYRLENPLPPIEADIAQVRQIVMNLATNASEAIGDRDGRISIATGAQECTADYLRESYLTSNPVGGLYVFIEISDTGCGMDAETQKHIFEPFFTTKFIGRGLGLAAVSGILRGHRGALKVSSESGKGSTFRVLFPAIQ